MKFAELQAQARRLAILQGLQGTARYRASARLLRAYVEAVGVTAMTADIDSDLAWLSLQGLVTLDTDQGVTSATLTVQGADVVSGHAIVDGVQRPDPA